MRNFEDRDLLVQVQIAFYDSSGNVMDTIETGTMSIGANQPSPSSRKVKPRGTTACGIGLPLIRMSVLQTFNIATGYKDAN